MSQMPLGTMEETHRSGGKEEKHSSRVYTHTTVMNYYPEFVRLLVNHIWWTKQLFCILPDRNWGDSVTMNLLSNHGNWCTSGQKTQDWAAVVRRLWSCRMMFSKPGLHTQVCPHNRKSVSLGVGELKTLAWVLRGCGGWLPGEISLKAICNSKGDNA